MTSLSDAQSTMPIGPIYHYTSQNGLLGIIASKAIWASNISYLNDATELAYAVHMAADEIQNLEKSSPTIEVEFLEILRRSLSAPTWSDPRSIYVCSFSENPDLLSQWRGYCPSAGGFSVGFDFSSVLYDVAKSQEFSLFRCVYDRSEQVMLIREFLQEALRKFHEAHTQARPNPKQAANLAASACELDFLKLAPILKHPTFAEENEWRLVSRPIAMNHPQIRYREGRSMLVPYFEIRLTEREDDPLTSLPEIFVGPTLHPEFSKQSIRGYLCAQGVRGQDSIDLDGDRLGIPYIRISDAPYRVW